MHVSWKKETKKNACLSLAVSAHYKRRYIMRHACIQYVAIGSVLKSLLRPSVFVHSKDVCYHRNKQGQCHGHHAWCGSFWLDRRRFHWWFWLLHFYSCSRQLTPASRTVAFALASIAVQLAISTRTRHDAHFWSRFTIHFTVAFGTDLITFLCFAPHIGTILPAILCAVYPSGALEVVAVTSRAWTFTVHCCALDIAGSVSTRLFTELGVTVAALQFAFPSSAAAFALCWSFAVYVARSLTSLCALPGTWNIFKT